MSEEGTVNYKLTVQNEGTRTVERKLAYYNLDMILAIGYRVCSLRGIQFRKYASTVLKDYLIKGFAIHHNTASEVIYKRVDSNKEFMGLTTFKGELSTLKED